MSASIPLAGVDIGGTKIAVCLGEVSEDRAEVRVRRVFPTPPGPQAALHTIQATLKELFEETHARLPQAIGVSCGGPLDSKAGLVLSPPNLPGWDRVDVLGPLNHAFHLPAALQNDANAGALAEWRWGAGRGCRSLVFLTFGTGMGAGLVLDGRLYAGANDSAGEVGHIRLAESGPVGYGKAGSFEGFCSGGGIAQLARQKAALALADGQPCAFCPTPADLGGVTAETVGQAARGGDLLAREIYEQVGQQLGRGLSVLIDILNPERIAIGGIYGRQQALLEPPMLQTLRIEALPGALAACQVVPAGLGEAIGDLASLSVALLALEDGR